MKVGKVGGRSWERERRRRWRRMVDVTGGGRGGTLAPAADVVLHRDDGPLVMLLPVHKHDLQHLEKRRGKRR